MPNVTDDIADRIRAYVAERRLAPGDRLPAERDLAARLGVSRPTLREGLQRLADRGVLEVREKSGAYVRLVDGSELLTVRLQLEPVAARLAAERRTPEEAHAIAAAAATLARLVDDRDAFAAADAELHAAIARAGRNAVLGDVLGGLADLSAVSRSHTAADRATRERTLRTMREVAAAIERSDAGAAEQAMRDHLEATRSAWSR